MSGPEPVSGTERRPERVLALECAGDVGSVALRTGYGELRQKRLDGAGSQASQLLPAATVLLEAEGLEVTDLEAIMVGTGPGSFTGVRVAAAAGLGLAQALGRPLLRASSLAGAWAASLPPASLPPASLPPATRAPDEVGVLFDARGDRLYVGSFASHDGDAIVTQPPRFAVLAEIMAGDIAPGTSGVWMGPGAVRHREALEAAGFRVAGAAERCGEPSALGLLRLLELAPSWVEPWNEGDEPMYLRASSAERERRGA
jgi:tRNA threonylcarbamoyladenosine biosynthesis protein TsaB